MWIFARGFMLSAVAATDGHPMHAEDVKICVRFRVREHGEKFCQIAKVDPSRIYESAGTDYTCRVMLLRREWDDAAIAVFATVDYPNFKGAVDDDAAEAHRIAKRASSRIEDGWRAYLLDRYSDALHTIWGTHNKMQISVISRRTDGWKRKILSQIRGVDA
jgi:hypothetical protein